MSRKVKTIQQRKLEIDGFIEDYVKLVAATESPKSTDQLCQLVTEAAQQALDGQFILSVDEGTIDGQPKEFIFNLLDDTIVYMGFD